MWVTQTYLGTVEPNASLYVYYFFEDYVDDQNDFTKRVQHELERLGEAFGDQVTLLFPNPRYAGRIESEVRENLNLWISLRGNLPGLFISRRPLANLDRADDDCLYIPFNTSDPEKAAETIARVRGIANETLQHDYSNRPIPARKSFGDVLFDAIELKPGIFGFKIDLKRLRHH